VIVLPTVERLKLQASRASDISRQMAEAKSLRQESNTEQRTDLYMWPTPEQTTEGKAAELIAELYEALVEARIAVAADIEEAECGDDGRYASFLPVFVERLAKIDAALAKARGEPA
jgi:hypothetical protein